MMNRSLLIQYRVAYQGRPDSQSWPLRPNTTGALLDDLAKLLKKSFTRVMQMPCQVFTRKNLLKLRAMQCKCRRCCSDCSSCLAIAQAIGKSQESGNDRIVREADSGRARAETSQKHRDVTGEHECVNWQNLGMSSNDKDTETRTRQINTDHNDRRICCNVALLQPFQI